MNLENELAIQPTDHFKTTISKENLYFFGIYPINCKINGKSFENPSGTVSKLPVDRSNGRHKKNQADESCR